MNTPNKLTIVRILLVPIYVAVALYDLTPFPTALTFIVFVAACATDWFDGYLARKNNQVTNFGKIADPLADKMLVTAALLCLTYQAVISPWIALIILSREFIVSGIRITAASEGKVIAASMWGKVKTFWQFIAIALTILIKDIAGAEIVISVCMWIAAILTVISGWDYIRKNRKYLSMK